MVLPIGFFMPLPLAMMIPFMGIQSAVMAKQFGEGFQYGKRRISAMSNDEFNALTPQKMIENNTQEVRAMIPSMQAAVTDMREFQVFIIKEFIQTIRSIIDAGLGKLLGLSNDEINEFVQRAEHFIHGHFEGHGETTTPPSDEEPVTEPNKLHLTLSQISAANDLVLAAWIRNISDYDSQTQNWLTQEDERRKGGTPPEDSTPFQETTKLDPEFVATLTRSDLEKGGSRTRNYKGVLQKWKGTDKITWTKPRWERSEWESTRWHSVAINQSVSTESLAVQLVNAYKSLGQTSYVLEFISGTTFTWYLIQDDF